MIIFAAERGSGLMEQNRELEIAWDFVENTGKSIFLTGKAGTGKTTFLKAVKQHSTKRLVVVAPTGVAAINAGGVTIHSFFQLPLSPFVPNATIKNRFDFSKEKRKIISTIDMLVIDEISMVRSDLLDAIDSVLRRFREHNKPFGGVQLLMIGDLSQLTPVVTSEDEQLLRPYYDTPYFFGSHALRLMDYVTIQLNHVYRQHDVTFVDLLNHVREGKTTTQDLQLLNSRVATPAEQNRAVQEKSYIRLTTHNHLANHYNDSELNRLPGQALTYEAEIEGTFPEYVYPTNVSLTLKVGAQVMFVKNDISGEHLYYNGRIGKVTFISENRIVVQCVDDEQAEIVVEPQEWENAKYTLNEQTKEIETEVLGVFRQYPLRLAWSITIHKSQGLTFDHAIIDANYSFAPGQVYVALSRCRTLEGMLLAAPISPTAIIQDQRVETYIGHQNVAAQESIVQLPLLKEEYYRQLLVELFTFSDIQQYQEQLCRVFIDYFHRTFATLTTLQKQTMLDVRLKLMDVAEKWILQIQRKSVEELHVDVFKERVRRSSQYFDETLRGLFVDLIAKTQQVKTANKTAAKRLDSAFSELQRAVYARLNLLQTMAEIDFSVPDYLHAKQQGLLEAMEGVGGKSPSKRKKKAEKKLKEKKEPTRNVTLRLYRQGLLPDMIAKERGLSLTTIYSHLAAFIAVGDLSVDEFVDSDKQRAILMAIRETGTQSRGAIKALCPPDITWEDITLVLATIR